MYYNRYNQGVLIDPSVLNSAANIRLEQRQEGTRVRIIRGERLIVDEGVTTYTVSPLPDVDLSHGSKLVLLRGQRTVALWGQDTICLPHLVCGLMKDISISSGLHKLGLNPAHLRHQAETQMLQGKQYNVRDFTLSTAAQNLLLQAQGEKDSAGKKLVYPFNLLQSLSATSLTEFKLAAGLSPQTLARNHHLFRPSIPLFFYVPTVYHVQGIYGL